jgi:signal transduction histidine kinase
MEKNQITHGRALLQFYFLVVYVFLQFSWWTFLIIDLNREIHDLKVSQLSANEPLKKNTYDELLEKRKWMVLGESSVFLLILLLGVYRTWRSLRRETKLALLQRNFLLATAHELRTPVTSVRLQLDTILKHRLNPDQSEKLLLHAKSEADRLELLIEKALMATRLDNGKYPLSPEVFSPADLINQKLQSTFVNQNIKGRISIKESDKGEVNMDKTAFTSIFSNLLENALKYGGENGRVEISLKFNDAQLWLTVADNGPGIKEQDAKLIFNRFYRSGNEETRNEKGTGLGLFIVAQLVKAMKGQVFVHNRNPSGAVFEVSIPVFK